jgi:MFS transporter, AAHS family, 4-hydroxybenzoate transporter
MTGPIDVAKIIDQRPVSWFQWRVLLTCMAVAFLDGLGLQSIGVAAPALSEAWAIPRPALGPVFAAAPVGMILGALIMGPLADRVGRRRLVITATLTFGLFSLLTPLASNVREMVLLRTLTGLGLGGALPNLISLITEYSPAKTRGFLTTLTFSTLPLGSMLAGLAGPWLIPAYGWQSIFYLAGIVPMLVALIAMIWLPESLRYLVSVPGRHPQAAKILQRIAPDAVDLSQPVVFAAPTAAPRRASVARLFGPTRTSATFTVALIVGLNLFMINLLVNWLPTLLKEAGLSTRGALLSAALLNVSGAIGGIAWGSLSDRFGIHRVMGCAGLASGLAMLGLATSNGEPAVLILALTIVGLSVMGSQPGFYALIASVYPTAIRSTGIGTTLGMGRVGGVLGPALGGLLVAAGFTTSRIFLVVAGAGLLCACAVALLSRLRPNFV